MNTLWRLLPVLALVCFGVFPVNAFAQSDSGSEAPAGAAEAPPGAADSAPAEDANLAPRDGANPAPPAEDFAYDAFSIWHGVVREGGAYRRAAPYSGAEILEDMEPGTPVRVDGWVAGSMLYPDVITWASVDPVDGGGYIFGGSLAGVLPPAAPPPPDTMAAASSTWVDANLTLNVATVYEGGQPLKMMLMSPGRPGYTTDTGVFRVYSKLPSQTMTGPGYSVPGVPNVQYFVGGEALHGRYWTLPDVLGQTFADLDDNGLLVATDDATALDADGVTVNRGVAFGVPSSHGCLGLDLAAARWLYTQTGYGTVVDVHY